MADEKEVLIVENSLIEENKQPFYVIKKDDGRYHMVGPAIFKIERLCNIW